MQLATCLTKVHLPLRPGSDKPPVLHGQAMQMKIMLMLQGNGWFTPTTRWAAQDAIPPATIRRLHSSALRSERIRLQPIHGLRMYQAQADAIPIYQVRAFQILFSMCHQEAITAPIIL